MNSDVEFHIRHNYPWSKLPANIRQSLGNSQREYEKSVVNFSVRNQLRYKGNLVRYVKKDEKKYYEDLLQYSRDHLMLYPYHLSDVIVKGLRTTPFAYYINIMVDIMTQEKSYDSLPNFTAADCLRLLGIGRNQYIDLMNQCRSSKKFFRRRPVRELLPLQPIEVLTFEPWWVVQAGYITEDDVKTCGIAEKNSIDAIIDTGPKVCGTMDYKIIHGLYRKGLVYLDVSIKDDDCIIVPPLEGFVMNRVLGDYFETLLYKIFVSIDEHTTVAELANVLQIDLQLVKNAVSMYCRLGFAKKKGQENVGDMFHESWGKVQPVPKGPTQGQLLIDWTAAINQTPLPEKIKEEHSPDNSPENISLDGNTDTSSLGGYNKRIAFLFDSTLTAFLMMGNLSPGLKSHAVTMFEVGKLSDESLDSFLAELEKVDTIAEGEAQRYFDHAITLRDTIRFLRYNKDLSPDQDFNCSGLGIDLLRCESLLGLEPATCSRVLNKNYILLVSMAPLSNEIRPVSSCTPQHIGPAIPEVNSVWFKLFIYHLTGSGPPSLLLVKGTRLKRLPKEFQEYDRLLVTTWGHDPTVIPTSNVLLTLNDALSHSAVLVQVHGWQADGETAFIPFPLSHQSTDNGKPADHSMSSHSSVQSLLRTLDLQHTCGYITLLKTNKPGENMLNYEPNANSTAVSNTSSPARQDDKPKNGIKNTESALMLESELDMLNQSVSPEKKRADTLTLDVGENVKSCDANLESDWVLLDCAFGIPLFDAHVNQQVCNRIAAQSLCSRDNLEHLLQSSRKLSLQLLNFIATHQDLPVLQEHNAESAMLPINSDGGEQTVPLPTHNLLFCHGKLQTWNGL